MDCFFKITSKEEKKMFRIIIIFLFVFSRSAVFSQASAYTFSTATGTALTTMTGSTQIIASAQDDVSSAVTAIGFTFTFACTNYTQFSASSNGAMGLGAAAVTTSFSNSIAGASYPIIMPFWDDMHTCTTGKVHYLLTGSSPNRVLTVEWLYGNYGESAAAYTKRVQVKIYETTNVIDIVYGANTGAAPIAGSVGIASASTSYQSVTTSANTSSNAATNDANATFPASGRSYTFTPSAGSMSFTSATVVQASTATVTKCDVNQPIVSLQVVTSGSCSPISLTQLQMVMTGTAPTADVSLIHIYYTGTTSTFSAIGAFDGAGTSVGAGTITINGAQTLATGTNYFWIAYDMNTAGTISNTVDARLLASPTTTITVGGVARTVTANDPVGTRAIIACPPSPGGINTGITMWLKAGSGVTTAGPNVTAWADQSTAATSVTVNGSPDYVSSGYNFNPYINFTLSSPTGGDFLRTPNQNLRSFFWVAQLTNLTRKSTHLATYDAVTLGLPCGGCAVHGGENGGVVAQYGELGYGNGFFQAAGVWRKNGDPAGTSYNTPHSGNFDIVTALGGGTGSVNVFMGGQNDNLPAFDGRIRDWLGPVAEIISYSGAISTAQANKIESYLAIKYGITLGGNGSTTLAYTSTSGATIWTANSGYHNDVTGIGAETVEGLQQNKSKSINVPAATGPNDMPFTIAHDLISVPTAIGDNTYVVVGHNNGTISGTYGLLTHGGTALEVLQNRIYRVQTTNLTGGHSMMNMVNLEIEFDMSRVPGLGGGFGLGVGVNDPTKIRLLLDDNTTFGQGTLYEKAYTNSGVTGNVIKFLIPVADLSTTGTMFFRISSTSYATAPLPIELVSFSAQCNQNKVYINWTTASETNNDYFTISRTSNGTNIQQMAIIDGAGTSSNLKNYSWVDNTPLEGNLYYYLSQTDYDGTTRSYNFVSINCEDVEENFSILNLSSNEEFINVFYNASSSGLHAIKIIDVLGKVILNKEAIASKGNNEIQLDALNLSGGIYILNINNGNKSISQKIMLKK